MSEADAQSPTPNKPNKIREFSAGLAASMGGYHTGLGLGWSSGGMNFIRGMRGSREGVDSWISSILNLGAIASLLCTPYAMNRIGRKWTMIAALPLFTFSLLMLAFVQSDVSYIVMRFVMGFSVGCYSTVSPVYSGEIAETKSRGALGICFELLIACGTCSSYCLAFVPDFMTFNLAMIAPNVLFLLWMSFMPESPVFLLLQGKEEKARDALQWIRGNEYDIEEEFNEMKIHVARGATLKKATLVDVLRTPGLRRALAVGLLVMISMQGSGINVISYNIQTIFAAAASEVGGMLDPRAEAVITSCIMVSVTFVAMIFVDRSGRRPLMLVSMVLMGVFQSGLAAFFIVQLEGSHAALRQIGWLPLLCLMGFAMGFSVGAGPIGWLLVGELFSEEAKGVSAVTISIVSWLFSFATTWLFEFLREQVPLFIFFLAFAVLCFVATVLLYFYLVETKNRTFEEIQDIMEGKAPDKAPIGFRR